MATFFLIRHGDKAHPDLMVGRMPGVHLTAPGRQQARDVAAALRKTRFDLILASPLERTIETARPLARALKLEVQTDTAFHEVDMGAWTGIRMKKLATTRAWKEFCRFPAGTAIPAGETLVEVQSRIVSGIIRLAGKQPDGCIAIFTHEDPIRLAICHFIGAPINVYEHITIPPGSVTELVIEDHRAILRRLGILPRAGKL